MLLLSVCSSLGICCWLIVNASIPGGQCLSAAISSRNSMGIRVEATKGTVTAVTSHLQFCCVMATGRRRGLGKTDLSSNLVQLVSCLSWAVGMNIIDSVMALLCYRFCIVNILSSGVAGGGWLEVSKCLTALLESSFEIFLIHIALCLVGPRFSGSSLNFWQVEKLYLHFE